MNARCKDWMLCRRLLLQARPYWFHIAGFFFVSLLSAPLTLLAPVPLKIAVDCIIGSAPLPRPVQLLLPGAVVHSAAALLLVTAGSVVLLGLVEHLHGIVTWLLQAYVSEKLVLDFRSRLFRHMQRLSLSYHDTKGTTDSTYRIQYDAPAIQTITVDGVVPMISETVTLLGMLYVALRLDWQLALVGLAVSPALLAILGIYRERLRNRSREIKQLESSAMSVVQEVLAAARVVKAFGQEDREQDRFVRRSSAGMRARLRFVVEQGGFGLFIGLTLALGAASVLFVGVSHVRSGQITLGALLLVLAYLSQLYGPLKTISKKVASLQSQLASAERVFSLLDELPDVVERPNARPLIRASGGIAFRNVAFSYSEDRLVLRNLSFVIESGAKVGIGGTTGAGKTTLVSLLMRFYDPIEGQILLDGLDLRDYKLSDLRNQFAIVLQDPVLFSTTIAENIAYARPTASDEEIVAAAKLANAHDFILRLPKGYQAQVGERGMSLSGGERQRISLARAFLKNAPILILDEPTSSVDVKTEAAIIEAMERLMCGRTALIIAHRASALQNCDLQLIIEHGQLAGITQAVPSEVGAL